MAGFLAVTLWMMIIYSAVMCHAADLEMNDVFYDSVVEHLGVQVFDVVRGQPCDMAYLYIACCGDSLASSSVTSSTFTVLTKQPDTTSTISCDPFNPGKWPVCPPMPFVPAEC